jgi:hypothetical protein
MECDANEGRLPVQGDGQGNYGVFEHLFQKHVYQFDRERRITLLRSSDDPELECYFDVMRSPGSTHMESDGRIYVKIHDKQNPSKGVWLEELAHALQFIKYGNVPLSSDDRQRRERELEVAQCLKERAGRLHPLDEDMRHLEQAIEYYGQ